MPDHHLYIQNFQIGKGTLFLFSALRISSFIIQVKYYGKKKTWKIITEKCDLNR